MALSTYQMWDLEELAWRALGKSYDEAEAAINDGEDIEEAVYQAWDIGFDAFAEIAHALVDFTPLQASPLTGKSFRAFVDEERKLAIYKKEPSNLALSGDEDE